MSKTLPLTLDSELDLERAAERIVKARTTLQRDHTWYGNLTLRLRTVPSFLIDTLATDGTCMFYNPRWVLEQDDATLLMGCAHEVLHCAFIHPYRIGHREPRLSNVAADYIVNEHLDKSGFTIPSWALRNRRFDGMYYEQVYAILEQERQEQGAGDEPEWDAGGEFLPAPADGQGDDQQSEDGDPSASGDEPGGQGHARMRAVDWEIAVEEASMLSRKAGTMPGELDAYMQKARESTHDWRAELREFFDYIMPSDYSWATPNRSYLGMGYILPGVKRDSLPRIVNAIDSSGSIYPELLNVFGEETQAIMRELRPECLEVVYVDTKVNNVETFYPDDEITFHPRGRGGTCFQPAFDYVQENLPIGMLYFTDGMNSDSEDLEAPDCPVLWVVVEQHANWKPPFGRKIVVSLH